MTVRARRTRDVRQGDLFGDARALYPVHAPEGVVTASDFRLQLSQAVSEALRLCGKSRAQVTMEMALALGEPTFSEHMLNAYASPARESHDIPVTRLRALVNATGALWLWDVATTGQGVTVLVGADAIYAQQGLLLNQIAEAKKGLKTLAQVAPLQPATIRARGRGR